MRPCWETAHVALCLCLLCFTTVLGNWEEWWTYDGISGPDFWGLLNPDWNLCSKGRRQSPVDLNPSTLLFDPHLKPLQVDQSRISGIITNTGHGVIFRVSDSLAPGLAVNISGGPLSYQYRFHELHIHYGRSDDRGSEHTIAGKPFPAEVQIFGFNSDLYANMSEAVELRRSEGLVGISILLQLGDLSHSELRVLTGQLHRITYRGQEAAMKHLSIKELLPETEHFMTYEGSLTMPGCHETVTWIVLNKPIYITKQQLYLLRKLMQGDELNARAPLSDNFRPTLPVNQRLVRTNIDFKWKQGSNCPSMYKNMYYQANTKFVGP